MIATIAKALALIIIVGLLVALLGGAIVSLYLLTNERNEALKNYEKEKQNSQNQ